MRIFNMQVGVASLRGGGYSMFFSFEFPLVRVWGSFEVCGSACRGEGLVRVET